jgi:hypothetical protein
VTKSSPRKMEFWVAGTYISIVILTYAFLQVSAKFNSGDSGEGGILLIPLLFPWFFMFSAWGLPGMVLAVLLNASIIYYLFRVLRWLLRKAH